MPPRPSLSIISAQMIHAIHIAAPRSGGIWPLPLSVQPAELPAAFESSRLRISI